MYYAVNTTLNTIVHVHAEGVARDSVRVWGVDLMHEAWYGDETQEFNEFVGTLAEAVAYATACYPCPFTGVYVDLYDKGEYEPEGFTIEDVVDTYYFMYDDAYGCEQTFSFKGSYGAAMQLAEELDGDGEHDCLTVLDSDLNSIYPLPF